MYIKTDEVIIEKINPVIVYPKCITEKGIQDNCINCEEKNICNSPKSWCVKPYPNHPKGCPNFNNKIGCPPHFYMYDDLFDMKMDSYVVVTKHNLKDHFEYVKNSNPNFKVTQTRNILYWQDTVRKLNEIEVLKFIKDNIVATTDGESLGVDIILTLKQIGIDLKFSYPIDEEVYRVALLSYIKDISNTGYIVKNHYLVKKYK